MRELKSFSVHKAITANATSEAFVGYDEGQTFHAHIEGTGPISATVTIEGQNADKGWVAIGSIALSNATATGATADDDKFTVTDKYARLRVAVSAISGTGATVWCGYAQ